MFLLNDRDFIIFDYRIIFTMRKNNFREYGIEGNKEYYLRKGAKKMLNIFKDFNYRIVINVCDGTLLGTIRHRAKLLKINFASVINNSEKIKKSIVMKSCIDVKMYFAVLYYDLNIKKLSRYLFSGLKISFIDRLFKRRMK